MRSRTSIAPRSMTSSPEKIPGSGPSSLKNFIAYLRRYLREQSTWRFLLTMLFVVALVTINYTFGIERRLLTLKPWPLSLAGFFLFYGSVLSVAWALQGPRIPDHKWRWLLVLAPLYFSCKMIHWDFSLLYPAELSKVWDRYATIVLQLPAKFILLLLMLWACRKTGGWGTAKGLGCTTAGFSFRPYLLLLLFLTPLIALASTQPDFLRFYPKMKNLAFINVYAHPSWPWKLLYELSYGLDFFSIELFFRGFLVIGLARWAGQKAILPMAVFYCTVHFGKPLAECISSFFGGLVLGVLAERTRSILGGLMVHLGLAWMMEIGGWLGNFILLSNS